MLIESRRRQRLTAGPSRADELTSEARHRRKSALAGRAAGATADQLIGCAGCSRLLRDCLRPAAKPGRRGPTEPPRRRRSAAPPPASAAAAPEPKTVADIFPAGAQREAVMNSCGTATTWRAPRSGSERPSAGTRSGRTQGQGAGRRPARDVRLPESELQRVEARAEGAAAVPRRRMHAVLVRVPACQVPGAVSQRLGACCGALTSTASPLRPARNHRRSGGRAAAARAKAVASKVNMDEIFPPGEGRDLVLNNCQNCHTFVPIVVLQMEEEAWTRNSIDHRERVTHAERRGVQDAVHLSEGELPSRPSGADAAQRTAGYLDVVLEGSRNVHAFELGHLRRRSGVANFATFRRLCLTIRLTTRAVQLVWVPRVLLGPRPDLLPDPASLPLAAAARRPACSSTRRFRVDYLALLFGVSAVVYGAALFIARRAGKARRDRPVRRSPRRAVLGRVDRGDRRTSSRSRSFVPQRRLRRRGRVVVLLAVGDQLSRRRVSPASWPPSGISAACCCTSRSFRSCSPDRSNGRVRFSSSSRMPVALQRRARRRRAAADALGPVQEGRHRRSAGGRSSTRRTGSRRSRRRRIW